MDLDDDLGVVLMAFLPRIRSVINAAQVYSFVCAVDRDVCICSINLKLKEHHK